MTARETDPPPVFPPSAAPRPATRLPWRRSDASKRRPGSVAFYARILRFFRPDLPRLMALVALIWISLGAGVLEGLVVGVLTDAVLSQNPTGTLSRWLSEMSGVRPTVQVVALAAFWFVLRATNDVVLLLREMINHRLRYNGTARVRTELFDHLQTLSPAYHTSRPQGDAIYRLSVDAQGFFGVLDTFVGAANSALTLIVIGIVMADFNGTITVVCLCLAPLLIVANYHFSRTIRRTSEISKQTDTEFTTFVQRAMATVSLAQLFGRQRTESDRFRYMVDRTISAGMRMSWQQQIYPAVQRILYASGHAFVLGYGGYLALRDRGSDDPDAFTVGGITAMLVYLGQLWEPLRRLAGFTADVQTNAAASSRVFHVLDLIPTVADSPTARPLSVRSRRLGLHQVEFAYDPLRPVLRGVDVEIEPGQMIAFFGPSGAGKSTLLNLLPRFYDPTAGHLSLDGDDLREIRLADTRAHVALVPQDSPVIAGTISENIAFGRQDATEQEIRTAAETAGANRFIEELPQGYDTEVSEGGQNLSGGQRQRLAIARALLTEAPILVLDEPTSGLDSHHSRLILETLQRLKGQRTIILVTHSFSAVTECDRIYVLQSGRIAEAGTNAELIARNGIYAAMAKNPGAAVKASA